MKFELDDAVGVLSRTPGVLAALVKGAGEQWTTPDYGPGTWSAREIVAHLVFNEQTDTIPRMRHILTHGDDVAFQPFDRAGHKHLLEGRTIEQLLEMFERERGACLASLKAAGLGDAQLARRGLHPALGTVTLSQLLATWVVHDLNHISQIAKAMAYQYKAEVGPWEAYLSILAEPRPR